MRTVTIGVSNIDDAKARMNAALRGENLGDFISFESVELLWKVLSPRRWELLQAMAGREAMSLRAISRLAGKDLKTVHGDVHALLNAGILERLDEGVVFPYDSVHVDFTVGGRAA